MFTGGSRNVHISHLTFFLSCETGWGCLQIALSPSLLGTNMLICPMEMRILGNPLQQRLFSSQIMHTWQYFRDYRLSYVISSTMCLPYFTSCKEIILNILPNAPFPKQLIKHKDRNPRLFPMALFSRLFLEI